jgi:hypothetical protein
MTPAVRSHGLSREARLWLGVVKATIQLVSDDEVGSVNHAVLMYHHKSHLARSDIACPFLGQCGEAMPRRDTDNLAGAGAVRPRSQSRHDITGFPAERTAIAGFDTKRFTVGISA